VAGTIFSILMIVSLGMVRVAVPDHPAAATWWTDPAKRSQFGFAINLVPFAGIAFLWFIGVLRNRIGKLEDQFFATVFLGSGLLFVASLFSATAIAGALLEGVNAGEAYIPNGETSDFVRRAAHALLNIFALKMAAVFTFTTSALALRTRILPRWLAFSGFACGLVLLAVIASWAWIALIFPSWILLVSAYILVADLHRRRETDA
jgi:hypothetical protein